MKYPKIPDLKALSHLITFHAQAKHERGATHIEPLLRQAEKALQNCIRRLSALSEDKAMSAREPDALRQIQALRPRGPRKIWQTFDEAAYAERIQGALIGRLAGNTLGAAVEFWEINKMKEWAAEIGDAFPPTDYWSAITTPNFLRYDKSRCDAYTRTKMDGVPVDDDIAYTLVGLLILEEYGPEFTLDDVGKAWVKYLPLACGPEAIALRNLKKGIPAAKVGAEAPDTQNIGAAIRADPWGYAAAGWPERAAELAWRDASLSHRRNGMYGEMFFAAAIAAAFTVKHPVEALEIGLTEIPKECALAKAVRWALKVAPRITNYQQAREATEKKFAGMHDTQCINNACLTIWGLTIGGTDFTKVISEIVAMGMDNDCTAATAGSICGAVVGSQGIPAHWSRPFNNKIHSYLISREQFAIDDVFARFTKQARRVYAS